MTIRDGAPALPGTLFLAPMAEVTTPALRRIVSRFWPDTVLCSEMLSAGAIAAGGPHNEPLVRRHDFDRVFVYQLVGAAPEVMAEAARRLSQRGCDGIDINMGCPKHDIVKKGMGAALLRDAALARQIVRACRVAVDGRLSVKLRSGWESSDEERLAEFLTMIQDEGADYVTLHGRHARLGFTRAADWRLVALARRRLAIPVVGNGDIAAADQAARRMRETGCQGVMIGRRAVERPWIFRAAGMHLAGREDRFTVDAAAVFDEALAGVQELLPPNLHKSRGHRVAVYLCHNARFGHELFTRIRRCDRIDDMRALVRDYYGRNPAEARFEYHITPEAVEERRPAD